MENINEFKSFIKEKRTLFFSTILFIILFPFVFNWIFYKFTLFPSKATYDGWFSFISSYTGAICTVIIFLITLINSHIDKIQQKKDFDKESATKEEKHKKVLKEQRDQFDAKYELLQKQHTENIRYQREEFNAKTIHQEKLHRENLEAQKKAFDTNAEYEKFQNCLFLSSKIAPRFELTYVEQYESNIILIKFKNITTNIAVFNSISSTIITNDSTLQKFDSVFDSSEFETSYIFKKCIINDQVQAIYFKLPDSLSQITTELNFELTFNIKDYIGNNYIQTMHIKDFPKTNHCFGALNPKAITYKDFRLENIADTHHMLKKFEIKEMLNSLNSFKSSNFMNKN